MLNLLAKCIIMICMAFTAVMALTDDEEMNGIYSGLKTKDGMLLIYNFQDYGFTLDIKADNMEKVDADIITFMADGKILQIVPVPFNLFLSDEELKKTDIDILSEHLNFESEYLNEGYGKEIPLNITGQKTTSGIRYLFSEYEIPKEFYDSNNVIIKKQLYATALMKNHVLMLSSLVSEKDDEKQIMEFLQNTIVSLKVGDKPFNVEYLQDSLKQN